MTHISPEVEPLRIAMVAPPWFHVPPDAYGGIEWICSWLVDGLVDRGHDVTLIAAGEHRTRAEFRQTYPEPPSSRLGEPLPELIQAAAAAGVLADMEVDVIHDHSIAGPLLARGRKTRTVVTAHGPTDGEVGRYYRKLGDTISLVAITDAQRLHAPDLPWAGTVYNAIPVAEYPFNATKEDFVLFLGRMSPEKGAHLAIDAAREAGLPIVIAGKCIEKIERDYFALEVGPRLGDDTEWIGQADAAVKKDLLGRARCLVFPIQWEEPFGIVMVEALACGTPVVALGRGSVPEIVEHDVTGFVLKQIEDLPGGIDHCLKIDPAACRERAERLFDVSQMVAGYEAIYRAARV